MSRWRRAIIGVDDGTAVPFAALLALIDYDGAVHIAREVYRKGLLESDKAEGIEQLAEVARSAGVDHIEAVIVDPAAAGVKTRLRSEGWKVVDGINDVLTGIAAVRQLFSMGRITIQPQCLHLCEELESYEWMDDGAKDKPVKENDHAADALRYLVMYLAPPPASLYAPDTVSMIREKASMYRSETGSLDAILTGAELIAAMRRGEHGSVWKRGAGSWRRWGDSRPQASSYVLAVSVGVSDACLKLVDTETRELAVQGDLSGSPAEIATAAARLALWASTRTSRPRVIWKRNGPGTSFGEALGRLGIGAPVYRFITPSGKATTEPGWFWTLESGIALANQFGSDIASGKYIELDPRTADDLSRWTTYPNGSVGPVSLAADIESIATSSDRAWAAMLAAHAMRWINRTGTGKPKPAWGSIEWHRQQEAKEKANSL